jgi:hypothetical protein
MGSGSSREEDVVADNAWDGVAPSDPEVPESLEKRCSKCGQVKPIAEFYLRRKSGRRVAACRTCCRRASRVWHRRQRERDEEGYRARRRRNYANEDKGKRRARWRRQYRRQRERAARRNRFRYLRRLGVLELEESCADCGGEAEDLHHRVVDGEMVLTSLCHKCHMARHFAQWREHGGGPLRRHWELDED